jgi:aspartokinase
MTPQARLGGFKILKDVVRISIISPKPSVEFPAQLFQVIAGAKINLPYVTAVNDGHTWGLNIMVESAHAARTSQVIEQKFGKISTNAAESAILSIFPHKSDPTITGSLLEVFDQEGIDPDGYANSPSAISAVLKRGLIKKASNALFGPFSFSAYRTPADWKMAQKGKEQLYKEVVASYQEKRPKVYGLEYQEGQEFLQIELRSGQVGPVGTALKEFARIGHYFTFLATSPVGKKTKLFVCLPTSDRSNTEIVTRIAPKLEMETISPVATFAMNGPHFGDRYGIASELLHALNEEKVGLLGLNCTIASIIGVVPSPQIQPAIHALQKCFEVPSVTKKDHLPM